MASTAAGRVEPVLADGDQLSRRRKLPALAREPDPLVDHASRQKRREHAGEDHPPILMDRPEFDPI